MEVFMFGKTVSIILLSLLLIVGTAFASGEKGKFGIGFTVTESTPTFMGTLWVSNAVTLEPMLAYSTFSLDDDHSATQLVPGLGVSFHMRPGKDTRPFVGLRFMYNTLMSNEESYSDLYLGPAFGITHYFANQFAISGEYRINVITTDKEFSPSDLIPDATYIQTGALLLVHFYF
jgi:hypothetical protein